MTAKPAMATNTPLRALSWAAVSTPQQAKDDKISIPQQKKDNLAVIEQYGWILTDTLVIPGHSRHFYSLAELASFARRKGIDAVDRLVTHMQQQDFDVLIARNTDRLGRTQALGMEIIERIIEECGAKVYLIEAGLLERGRWREIAAITTYKAAADIDNLRRRRDQTLDDYARRGIPVGSSTMWPFREIREIHGSEYKRVGMEVDPALTPLLAHLADLILEGVGWREIESELYRRYGYVKPDTGKPYPRAFFYKRIHDPKWWGHTARSYKSSHGGDVKNKQANDLWVFDDQYPLPENVRMWRDTHPPIWAGELGEDIKAELRRRRLSNRGRTRQTSVRPYAGLFVCGNCNFYMKTLYKKEKNWRGLGCHQRFFNSVDTPACPPSPSLPYWKIREHISEMLTHILDTGTLESLSDYLPEIPQVLDTTQSTRAELEAVKAELDNLVARLGTMPPGASDILDAQITRLAERRNILEGELRRLASQQPVDHSQQAQKAYDKLLQTGIAGFWEQSNVEINQALHQLLQGHVFVVLEGEIIGLKPAPPGRQRKI